MPDPPARGERLSEWSPEREALARIQDELRGLRAALIAVNGVKPPSVRPAERPITAVEKARHRHALEAHRALVRRVLPDRR